MNTKIDQHFIFIYLYNNKFAYISKIVYDIINHNKHNKKNKYNKKRIMNKRIKILIIEDNIDIQELYKIYFEDAGFEVYSSMDGLHWITKILEIVPDLIILDIMMPQMNGFEVLETIKNQSSIKIPVIICSNLSQQADIDKAYELWADLYLRKSDYQGAEIVDKINEFLNKK